MSLLVWNCQGLGSPWTIRLLGELVKTLHPSLDFVSKTKHLARRCNYLRDRSNYFGVGMGANGKSNGLMLQWMKDLNITIQSLSSHHIDITVAEEGKDSWMFMGTYGHLDATNAKSHGNYYAL
ncbi:UNVERIFIED_CONTAM: hypothetical protein Sradi_2017100 [Sesamum radiatum]|uniref:Uncharacterized protein n=1 Tax=Sesamum radiatum TaxID=300843 RepID=A0AAW2TGU4_SESRA